MTRWPDTVTVARTAVRLELEPIQEAYKKMGWQQVFGSSGTVRVIADVYERELDKSVGVISQLIPPVIIVIIAVLVGLVVYSILSAVFEMTRSLQLRPH